MCLHKLVGISAIDKPDGHVRFSGFSQATSPSHGGQSLNARPWPWGDKGYVTTLVGRQLDALKERPYPGSELEDWWKVGGLRWIAWPQKASWMKGRIAFDAHREIEEFVESTCRTPLLVLDDLGRERMKGSYQDDYAAGHLDRIIDARSRNLLPVLWTTNLTPRELMAFYGSAMVSRLLGLSQLIELPTLPDLRMPGTKEA